MYWRKPSKCLCTISADSTNWSPTAYNCCKIQHCLDYCLYLYGHHVLPFAKFIISKLTKPHICCTHLLSPCSSTWKCTWKYSVRMFMCCYLKQLSLLFNGQSSLYTLWREVTACSSSLSYKPYWLVKIVIRLWVKYQFSNNLNQSLLFWIWNHFLLSVSWTCNAYK